ncbi:MAG: membrane protein insertase YidC [Burkholderiales bacterium]|nr:membrane protein insertase YidC [Burkholderiales bacterium]
METRRLILFFIFTFSLVMLWSEWQKLQQKTAAANAPPPIAKDGGAPGAAAVPAAPPAGVAAVPGAGPAPAPQSAAVPGATPAPAATAPVAAAPVVPQVPAAVPTPSRTTIVTDVVRAEIVSEGADLRLVELTRHKDAIDPARAFVLLGPHNHFAQTGLLAQGVDLPTHRTPFALVPGETTLKPGQDKLSVRFEAQAGAVRVAKIYTFHRGNYAIDVAYEIVNGGAAPLTPSVYLQFVRDGKAPAGESQFLMTFTGAVFYNDRDKFLKQDFADIEKGKPVPAKPAPDGWVGMIQHYFASAWIPPATGQREFYSRKVAENLYSAGVIVPAGSIAPGASGRFESKLWVGPQDQDSMKPLAAGLDLVVDYGWLTIIAQPMFWLLKWLYSVFGNWGLAIIGLTVIIKAAFFPLSAASYKSMARMKKVTPRLMALRERYGNDRMKMNQAMMELYKEEKINPLGGCFPILVQIPVFIALYWVLLASVEMRNAPFYGWIKDLSAQDPYYILPIIMAISMFVQTKMNPTPPDPLQAKMMTIMPIVFSIFFFFFPAGLVLYWVVNNVLSIAQQWQITRMIESGEDPDKKKKK